MKITEVILLVLVSAWTLTSSLPVKPLNERSTDLTWQAWLLIDESQNKDQGSTARRRITPKSVFIAPTFRPESLPACSEGYQSDALGRCIKIIMLNEEVELNFLLQKLNDKFGNQEVDYDYEDPVTTGPIQVNIPLNVDKEDEVAIVVAPSNTFNESQNELPTFTTEEKVNVSTIAGILGVKQEEVATSTITSTPKIETTTKTLESTDITTEFTASFFMDTTKQIELKTDSTTSSMPEDTTQELTTTIKRETTDYLDTQKTTQIEPTSQPFTELVSTTNVENIIPMESSTIALQSRLGNTTEYPQEVFLETNMLMDQAGPEIKNSTTEYTVSTTDTTTIPSTTEVIDTTKWSNAKKDLIHKRTTSEQHFNQVIFPDSTENPINFYTHLNQIHSDPATRLAALSNDLVHKGIEIEVEHQKIDGLIDKELMEVLHQRFKAHRENHRNREKHSDWFKLPPKWNVNASKPVVYRFSRKHFINEQDLHGRNFYREVSPGMFGFSRKKMR